MKTRILFFVSFLLLQLTAAGQSWLEFGKNAPQIGVKSLWKLDADSGVLSRGQETATRPYVDSLYIAIADSGVTHFTPRQMDSAMNATVLRGADSTTVPAAGYNSYIATQVATSYDNFLGITGTPLAVTTLDSGEVTFHRTGSYWAKVRKYQPPSFINLDNLTWYSSTAANISLRKSGTSLVCSIPAGFIVTGSSSATNGAVAMPAYSGTLSNNRSLLIDVSNPASPVWVDNIQPTYANTNSLSRKVAIINSSGNPHAGSMPSLIYPPLVSQMDLLYNYNIGVCLMPGNTSANMATISAISGNDVTLSINTGLLVTFGLVSGNSIATPALSSITLSHGLGLYLDMTSGTPVWSTGVATSKANFKGDIYHIAVMVNLYGKLWSPIASMDRHLAVATANYLTPSTPERIRLVVKKGGTPGVDCFDTTITTAEARITDAASNKRYVLDILPGYYYPEPGPDGYGLDLKEWIDLNCFPGVEVRGPEGPALNRHLYSTIAELPDNITITGGKWWGYQNKYPWHGDQPSPSKTENVVFRNAEVQHLGDTYQNDAGDALYEGQEKYYFNVRFNGDGYFCHTASSTTRDTNMAVKLVHEGCEMVRFFFNSHCTYTDDSIVLINNVIDTVQLGSDSTAYHNNPNDRTCNRGYLPPFPRIYEYGNKIGVVIEDSLTRHLNNNMPTHFTGYNDLVYNAGVGTIPKGYAYRLGQHTGTPHSIANMNTIPSKQAILVTSMGPIDGFAQEDIPAGERQYGLIGWSPIVWFDHTGSNIAYNDPLALDYSTGAVIKWTSGEVLGYAMQAATGDQLVRIKWINNKP